MIQTKKLAMFLSLLTCVAAGSTAEAARVYNRTGKRIGVWRWGPGYPGSALSSPTSTEVAPYLVKNLEGTRKAGEPLLDSQDWTENEGERSPSINWTENFSVVIAMTDGSSAVYCRNKNNDFQGGNYLIVTLEGGRLVAKMYDSNDKELWTHVTKYED